MTSMPQRTTSPKPRVVPRAPAPAASPRHCNRDGTITVLPACTSLCLVAAPALLCFRALGEHQIAGIFRVQHQSRSTGDVQDDSVLSRIRRDDDVALAAAALRADPDRVLEPAAQIVQLL